MEWLNDLAWYLDVDRRNVELVNSVDQYSDEDEEPRFLDVRCPTMEKALDVATIIEKMGCMVHRPVERESGETAIIVHAWTGEVRRAMAHA